MISGTGSVEKAGSGTLTLTGANTYSGGATISAGTLQIGNGGTSGSIAGIVTEPGLGGTAHALDDLQNDPNADQADLLQQLYGLNSVSELDQAVGQLSGDGLAGPAQTVQDGITTAMNQLPTSTGGGGGGASFAGLTQLALADTGAADWLATDRLWAAMPEAGAAAGSSRLIWVQGVAGYGSQDGQGVADGQHRSYGGAVGGLRIPLQDDLEVGPVFSGFAGRTETENGLTRVDSTSTMAALYGLWTPGKWSIDGALGAALHRFDSERDVAFGSFQGTATGKHDGYELVGRVQASYDETMGPFTVAPTAGLTTSWLYEEAWQESGGGGADLAIDRAETTSVQPDAGVGLRRSFAVGDGLTLVTRGQLLWIGQWGDSSGDYTAGFTGQTTGWTVPSLSQPRNAAAVGLSADLVSKDGWTLQAAYAGRFATRTRDNGILLGVQVAF